LKFSQAAMNAQAAELKLSAAGCGIQTRRQFEAKTTANMPVPATFFSLTARPGLQQRQAASFSG
jgi:hypothetical protein